MLYTISGHSDSILLLAVSQDSLTLFSSSKDKTIKVWNLKTGELVQTLVGHSCAVKDMFLNSNENILASTDIEGTVKIWIVV